MRAAWITSLDGPESVTIREADEPPADPAAVRIDVAAAGVTFPDVLLTRGAYQYKPELPFVPGTEVAGVVRTAPADSGFAPGDRVAAIQSLGGSPRSSTPTLTGCSRYRTGSPSQKDARCR
jgi:NADPH:quinone reductase